MSEDGGGIEFEPERPRGRWWLSFFSGSNVGLPLLVFVLGVMAGIPDISLPVPRGGYHGMYIELKVGGNKPSEKQQECIEALRKQGYRVEVCYGWLEAAEVIKDYLSKGERK